MTKAEAARRAHLAATLRDLGFTDTEADALRRISNTLRRWYEMECGMGDDSRREWHIERDENDAPFMVTHVYGKDGTKTYRRRVADRETGARKRLAAILKARNARHQVINTSYYGLTPDALDAYVQTDPRGAALYILRPGDILPGMKADECYPRGICVS